MVFYVGEYNCKSVGCAPDASLTGPSKNGADINRLGCSHVSVYTGRPRAALPEHWIPSTRQTHTLSIFVSFKNTYWSAWACTYSTCTSKHWCTCSPAHMSIKMCTNPKYHYFVSVFFQFLSSFSIQPFLSCIYFQVNYIHSNLIIFSSFSFPAEKKHTL